MSTFQIPASIAKVKNETSMAGTSDAATNEELDDSVPGTSDSESHALNLTSYASSLRTRDVQSYYSMDDQFTNSQTNQKWRLEISEIHDLSLQDSNKHKNFRGSGRSPVKDNNLKEQIDKVRQELIESGQMERLKEFADRRMSERGWRLDAMKKCREIVKQNGTSTTFDKIFQSVKEAVVVPKSVNDDILLEIQRTYKSISPE